MFQQSEDTRKVTLGDNCFWWSYQSNTITFINTRGKQERSNGTLTPKWLLLSESLEPNTWWQEIQCKCLFHNCKDAREDALYWIHLMSLQENISKALGIPKLVTKFQTSKIFYRAEIRPKHTVKCFLLKGYSNVLMNECLLVKNRRKPRIHRLEATTTTWFFIKNVCIFSSVWKFRHWRLIC